MKPVRGRSDAYDEDIAPWRQDLDRRIVRTVDGSVQTLLAHWLLLLNAAMAVFVALPVLAPVLLASGYTSTANLIYAAFKLTCHQLPYRSFFLSGYQMAYCQRNFAIYASVLLAGLVYARLRRRLRPLDWWLYLILIAPMAVDGFTQLFGWRESNWELRLLTGSLFGAASVWLVYPYFDRALDEVRARWDASL